MSIIIAHSILYQIITTLKTDIALYQVYNQDTFPSGYSKNNMNNHQNTCMSVIVYQCTCNYILRSSLSITTTYYPLYYLIILDEHVSVHPPTYNV